MACDVFLYDDSSAVFPSACSVVATDPARTNLGGVVVAIPSPAQCKAPLPFAPAPRWYRVTVNPPTTHAPVTTSRYNRAVKGEQHLVVPALPPPVGAGGGGGSPAALPQPNRTPEEIIAASSWTESEKAAVRELLYSFQSNRDNVGDPWSMWLDDWIERLRKLGIHIDREPEVGGSVGGSGRGGGGVSAPVLGGGGVVPMPTLGA